MKTSNDLMAYIDGFKDDISGNNILLVPFVRNGLVLYVFNKLSNRNAYEAAKILALLQGRYNINIDALKRSVLRLNENLVKMKKKITRAWNEIVDLLREFLQQYNHLKIIHILNLKKLHVIPKFTKLPQRSSDMIARNVRLQGMLYRKCLILKTQ